MKNISGIYDFTVDLRSAYAPPISDVNIFRCNSQIFPSIVQDCNFPDVSFNYFAHTHVQYLWNIKQHKIENNVNFEMLSTVYDKC